MADLVKERVALAGLANAARALGSRNYRTYVIGNAVSLCGTWMQKIATGWLAWELTHSGAWLGIISMADLIAVVLLGPLAGALADRVERLRLARLTQVSAMVPSFVLAGLSAAHLVTIGVLFALTLLLALVNAVDQPTRLALVPSLIERGGLSSAVAINSIVFNLARFIGPIGAGFAIVHGGVAFAFALNALSFLWFFCALFVVRLEYTEPPARRHGLFGSTIQGLLYSARHPGIGPVFLLLAAMTVLLRGVFELLPGFADAVFERGAGGLAWLTAATGLGAMLGGMWLIRRGGRNLTGLVITHLLWSAIALIGFAATHIFWLGAFFLFAAGFSLVAVGVSGQTLIQTTVDPAMRGRVMSLYGVVFRGGPALGALLLGVLSGPLGLGWPVIGAAALTGLVWLWGRLRQPAIAAALESER